MSNQQLAIVKAWKVWHLLDVETRRTTCIVAKVRESASRLPIDEPLCSAVPAQDA